MKLLPSTSIIASFLLSFGAAFAAEDVPNIILLMGDDHGWIETGYNGHPHLQTPVLDEMAATGLRMDRFYSASPVCSPTRGSVMTGRHPNRYGTFTPNWSIRPEEIGIGHVMKQAGYKTAHFGKWHLGPVKADSPTNPGAFGFDEWLSHDNFFEMDPVFSRNGGPPSKYPGESSEIVIDETIRFIGAAKKEKKPFMVVVWYGSPHEPYMATEADKALYANLPESYSKQTVSLTSLETGKNAKRSLRDVLQERFAEITAMDRSIGKLRDYLKQAGLRENTILWYCGDNGIPASGNAENPLREMKGAVYEGGVRVPGLIEWPRQIDKPRISETVAVTSDMLPTLCDLIGQPLPDRPLDGLSLKPLLEGKRFVRSKPVFFWDYNAKAETSVQREPYIAPKLQEGTTPLAKIMDGKYTRTFQNLHHPTIAESDYTGARAVMESRYKLVVNGGGKGTQVELFDLQIDPYEQRDIAKVHPQRVKRMQRQLKEWQDSVLNSLTGADYKK